MNIEQLVKDYPNDMELGGKIRELYWKGRENFDTLKEKMKDAKIFESPDGGKTVYVRGWGAPIDTRIEINKASEKQLNLFDEAN